MFTYLADIAKDYDLKYYNQETIIGGKNLGLSGYPQFNFPEEIGDAMINAGFNLVSLATNHAMDKGENAIRHSNDYWKSKENVVKAGTYSSWDERNNIPTYEINGITYAFLNYTYGTNGIPLPSGKEYLVNVWSSFDGYKEQVKKDIDQVRDKVDVVMVAMHWGTEYQVGSYDSYQSAVANYLASIGVDVIIGTHPHVVQPMEYIVTH